MATTNKTAAKLQDMLKDWDAAREKAYSLRQPVQDAKRNLNNARMKANRIHTEMRDMAGNADLICTDSQPPKDFTGIMWTTGRLYVDGQPITNI